ncbi:DUF1559 domain-containing protein [Fimbriiglobus ruber]|uniref:DUF1559 family PulG-like putative transporter n=1 Tax=Fimbriiglobus ruber TaxID=1908690 RepID=UPI000B4AEE62
MDLRSRDGVLYRDSAVRFSDITDGTSQTLLAGERPPSPDFQYGWWYTGLGQLRTGSLDMVLGVNEANRMASVFDLCPPGHYSFQQGRLDNPCDRFHLWSPHPSGANFAFADGSVKFLGYSAAPALPALSTRAAGDSVPAFD